MSSIRAKSLSGIPPQYCVSLFLRVDGLVAIFLAYGFLMTRDLFVFGFIVEIDDGFDRSDVRNGTAVFCRV